jgi:4-amino-4-deoxy-L-arabinose transferase-like glycosyltransferase
MQGKLIKFFKENRLLVALIFLAFVLRIYRISAMPPSLNWDEVSHGYNAYSLLKTGRDEWGNYLPIIFRAYGDYKLPFYVYAAAASELFFGVNAFAVRLPSVLAGVGIVVLTYYLVIELTKDSSVKLLKANKKMLAGLSALLVAVEPWSLFLSRAAFEANMGLFLFLLGFYFLLIVKFNTRYLVYSSIFIGLSAWTYNSYRVFAPIIVAFILFFSRKSFYRFREEGKAKKHFTIALIVALLFFGGVLLQVFSGVGTARFQKVSLIDEGAINQIIERRSASDFPPLISRVFYNRGTYFVSRFIINYISHYSGYFLFAQGGSHYQFSVPGWGLLYPLDAVLLIIGVIYSLKKKTRATLVLLSWFYLAPIPSSLTREAPHVLRSITFLPSPMIITAIGFVSSLSFLSRFYKRNRPIINKTLVTAYIAVTFLFAYRYLENYFNLYKKEYSWAWQYGYEQVVDYAKENYSDYDKIVITKKYGEPHEFFLFYWPWPPRKYFTDPNLIRFEQSGWFWVDRFDKFYFVNDWDIPQEEWQPFVLESGEEFFCESLSDNLLPYIEYDADRCLLITSPNNVPKGWDKLETIYYLDGDVAFELYEN